MGLGKALFSQAGNRHFSASQGRDHATRGYWSRGHWPPGCLGSTTGLGEEAFAHFSRKRHFGIMLLVFHGNQIPRRSPGLYLQDANSEWFILRVAGHDFQAANQTITGLGRLDNTINPAAGRAVADVGRLLVGRRYLLA